MPHVEPIVFVQFNSVLIQNTNREKNICSTCPSPVSESMFAMNACRMPSGGCEAHSTQICYGVGGGAGSASGTTGVIWCGGIPKELRATDSEHLCTDVDGASVASPLPGGTISPKPSSLPSNQYHLILLHNSQPHIRDIFVRVGTHGCVGRSMMEVWDNLRTLFGFAIPTVHPTVTKFVVEWGLRIV